tara:strand:- start:3344 stop:4012 length:669 start_codon:yes stop_codon:yes gene_type:complete
MSKMQDNFIDYSLTSPPYNISNDVLSKYKTFSDNMDPEDYFENQKNVISELLRVTKNHVFYNIQMVSGNKFALHRLIGHFYKNIKEVLIWKKSGQPAISEKVFNSCFEYIIVFSSNQPEKRLFEDANFDRGTQSNIFNVLNTHSNSFADVHKAVFPLDIPRYFMINFGKKNDIWFDPYMGTGTTGVAAVQEKKFFIGSEISEEYLKLSEKRILPYIQQQTFF